MLTSFIDKPTGVAPTFFIVVIKRSLVSGFSCCNLLIPEAPPNIIANTSAGFSSAAFLNAPSVLKKSIVESTTIRAISSLEALSIISNGIVANPDAKLIASLPYLIGFIARSIPNSPISNRLDGKFFLNTSESCAMLAIESLKLAMAFCLTVLLGFVVSMRSGALILSP